MSPFRERRGSPHTKNQATGNRNKHVPSANVKRRWIASRGLGTRGPGKVTAISFPFVHVMAQDYHPAFEHGYISR